MNLAPRIQPKVSFIPIIMDALVNSNPDDTISKFKAALGNDLTSRLKENWALKSNEEKKKQYFIKPTWKAPSGDFATQIIKQNTKYLTKKEILLNARKKIIKNEIDRAMLQGFYTPSENIKSNKVLVYEIQRKYYQKILGCRCPKAGPADPAQATSQKYGIITTRINCHDQQTDKGGKNEIYLISTAVDGNDKVITTTSHNFSLDDDANYVVYPNEWIYEMQNPNGFLEVAISMWEDDGGYEKPGRVISTVGAALSAIPTAQSIAASVALTIIGEIVSLAGYLDQDDCLGTANQRWGSHNGLRHGIGSYTLSYYDEDEGWFDDGYDFDLTINLRSD